MYGKMTHRKMSCWTPAGAVTECKQRRLKNERIYGSIRYRQIGNWGDKNERSMEYIEGHNRQKSNTEQRIINSLATEKHNRDRWNTVGIRAVRFPRQTAENTSACRSCPACRKQLYVYRQKSGCFRNSGVICCRNLPHKNLLPASSRRFRPHRSRTTKRTEQIRSEFFQNRFLPLCITV